jgi:thiol-disulfide isomerase/thioredoxin
MPKIHKSRNSRVAAVSPRSNKWFRDFVLASLAVGAMVHSSVAADPLEKLTKALAFKPRQPDVNYEMVKPEAIAECSIEETTRSDGKGFLVTGPGAVPLRWFVDTNNDNRLDRWCYFNAGVEVYRESDTNFNETADEYRWLSTEGLRWGTDKDEDGTIDSWSMISAEEVTAEVVRAAASRDSERFSRLLITESEIASLNLGKEKEELLKQKIVDARSQFKSWAAGQNVVTTQSKWTNFGADKPGIVPAGTDGSKKDIVVYENVVALLEDAGKAKQLLVGTMIQVGPTWRLIDLPKTVSEGAVVSDSGVFFSVSFQPRANGSASENTGGISKAMERLITELQEVDEKLHSSTASESEKGLLQVRRADAIEKLVSASVSAEDRTTWIHQFADTVGAAAQTGEYPQGIARLESFMQKLTKTEASKDDLAYVHFRAITADNNYQMQQPNADFEQLQKSYLTQLEKFIEQYPNSNDSAEAMIQIALSAEFSGDLKEAEKWYSEAKNKFGSTLPGRKGDGALRRLHLEGTKFGLQGATLDGREFNSQAYLGGPVIYHCWASWCDGCVAEMRALKELQNKYAKSNVRIVGINFDNTKAQGVDFLKKNSFPWVHLFEEGGLDSNLAVRFGILTLPINVVVDKDGKVIKVGAHWTQLDGIIGQAVR